MGEVRFTGARMDSIPAGAVAIYNGYIYKDNGDGQMVVVADNTDTAVAIAAYSSIDPRTGAAKTLEAGNGMAFYKLGSGAIVEVAVITGELYEHHCKVYVAQTGQTDGHGSVTSTSAVCIGHYWGKDAVTTSEAGQLIPVYLDEPIA